MKAELLTIAEYIESLERRIAALEARVAALETRAEKEADEPEVEVELIVDEDAESVEEGVPKPVVEDVPEPVVEKIPEPIVEDTPEPVKEEPATPAAPSAPDRHAPQQSSLFGTPVSDIRQAISIGDRFLFQRELFNSNGETMQKMLDRFNACASLAEAMDIAAQQQWDKESPTYELFVNVLRRRFQ